MNGNIQLTTFLSGRLGDITSRILLINRLAEKNGIEKVFFNLNNEGNRGQGVEAEEFEETGLFGIDDYILFNKEWFHNVMNQFIPRDEYKRRLKGSINVDYSQFSNAAREQPNALIVNITNVPIDLAFTDNSNCETFLRLFYREELFKRNAAIYPDIRERVCIHVRRTDFAIKIGHLMFTKEQLSQIVSSEIESGNRKFIICSDDIDWCKRNISGKDVDIIFHKPNVKSYNDVYLMASAKKIINKRSFFSAMAKFLKTSLEIGGK